MNRQEAYQVMFSQFPDVVNVEQMCEMLGGMSTKTGYQLLRSGSIKSFMIGRRYRIPKLNILEYLGVMERSES